MPGTLSILPISVVEIQKEILTANLCQQTSLLIAKAVTIVPS